MADPTILDINKTVINKLHSWIQNNVDLSQLNRNKPCTFHQGICHFDSQLPSEDQMAPELWLHYKQVVLDYDMTEELQRCQVLNWANTCAKLYAVAVPRDGNCLLHSAAFAIWGVDDSRHTLRRLLKMAMDKDFQHSYRDRWWNQRVADLRDLDPQTSEVISNEWRDVIHSIQSEGSPHRSSAVPHRFLESIHIYVLANILRRPIIILSDVCARSLRGVSLQENDILGIYLPLEWLPSECSKTPIIIGFSSQCSHFCPLLTGFHTTGPKSRALIPLVTRELAPLPVRCLKKEEEVGAGKLLQDFVVIKEVNLPSHEGGQTTVLCCSLALKPMAFDMNTVELHYQAFSVAHNQKALAASRQMASKQTTQNISAGSHRFRGIAVSGCQASQIKASRSGEATTHGNCIIPSCYKRAHKGNQGLCNDCLKNYSIAESGMELVSTGEGDKKKYVRICQSGSAPTIEQGGSGDERQMSMAELSEMNLIPTAPPSSSNFESSGDMLSMMNVRCQSSGCGYRCSKQTHPYCHECNNQLLATQGHQALRAEKSEQTQVACQDVMPLSKPLSEDTSGRISGKTSVKTSVETSVKMSEETPTMTSTGEAAVKTNLTYPHQLINYPPLLSQLNPPITTICTNTGGKHQPIQTFEDLRVASEGFNDNNVVSSREPTPPLRTSGQSQSTCVGPRCNSPVAGPGYLCEECQMIILQVRKKEKVVNSPVKVEPSSKPSGSGRQGKRSHGHHCLTSGCPNYGDPANLDLCSTCFRQRLKTSNGAQSSSAPGLSQTQVKPLLNNANQMHSSFPTPTALCAYSTASPPSHKKYVVPGTDSERTHSDFQESLMPSHDPTFPPDDMHSSLLSGLMSSPGLPTMQSTAVPTQSHLPERLRSESTSQLATSLSRAEQRSISYPLENVPLPPLTVRAERNFTSRSIDVSRDLHNLELGIKTNSKKCKADGCHNYGNSQKRGYCNACYPVCKLQEEELLRAQWKDDVVDSPFRQGTEVAPLVYTG